MGFVKDIRFNKPYAFKHTAIWFVEAAEWVSMLFERPESWTKFYKIPKDYCMKISAFSTNIQTLLVATQSLSLQTLPKHPKLYFFTL